MSDSAPLVRPESPVGGSTVMEPYATSEPATTPTPARPRSPSLREWSERAVAAARGRLSAAPDYLRTILGSPQSRDDEHLDDDSPSPSPEIPIMDLNEFLRDGQFNDPRPSASTPSRRRNSSSEDAAQSVPLPEPAMPTSGTGEHQYSAAPATDFGAALNGNGNDPLHVVPAPRPSSRSTVEPGGGAARSVPTSVPAVPSSGTGRYQFGAAPATDFGAALDGNGSDLLPVAPAPRPGSRSVVEPGGGAAHPVPISASTMSPYSIDGRQRDSNGSGLLTVAPALRLGSR